MPSMLLHLCCYSPTMPGERVLVVTFRMAPGMPNWPAVPPGSILLSSLFGGTGSSLWLNAT